LSDRKGVYSVRILPAPLIPEVSVPKKWRNKTDEEPANWKAVVKPEVAMSDGRQ